VDYDSLQVPVLPISTARQAVKGELWGNRNGFFSRADRAIMASCWSAFREQTWPPGLDDSGKPVKAPVMSPTLPHDVFPACRRTNWYSPLTVRGPDCFYHRCWRAITTVFLPGIMSISRKIVHRRMAKGKFLFATREAFIRWGQTRLRCRQALNPLTGEI